MTKYRCQKCKEWIDKEDILAFYDGLHHTVISEDGLPVPCGPINEYNTQFYEIDDLILMIYQHLSFMEMTQKELAKEIGISQQYLSDILHKHRNPSSNLLKYFKLEKKEIYIPLYAD